MPLESILHHAEQSYEVDMWAVGVIFLQFLTKKYNLFSNVRMINKPAVNKNLFYVNFILELASLFGSEHVKSICESFGKSVIYSRLRRQTALGGRAEAGAVEGDHQHVIMPAIAEKDSMAMRKIC